MRCVASRRCLHTAQPQLGHLMMMMTMTKQGMCVYTYCTVVQRPREHLVHPMGGIDEREREWETLHYFIYCDSILYSTAKQHQHLSLSGGERGGRGGWLDERKKTTQHRTHTKPTDCVFIIAFESTTWLLFNSSPFSHLNIYIRNLSCAA